MKTSTCPRSRRGLRPRAGFTLIEAVMALTLVALVVAGVLRVGMTSQNLFQSGVSRAVVLAQARRAVDRALGELAGAGRSQLAPIPVAPLGSSTLDYRRCAGQAAGVIQWDAAARLRFEYAPGEVDNGLDDDGNGLVDDGHFVWTRELGGAGERRVVLARNVRELLEGELPNGLDDNANGLADEAGVAFEMQGDRLILSVTLEVAAEGGATRIATVRSATALVND